MNPKEADLFCFENVIYLNLKRLHTLFFLLFFFFSFFFCKTARFVFSLTSHRNFMFFHIFVNSTSPWLQYILV